MQVITKLKLKMRTKHILTAMVLPALFAACTADDFETVNVAGDSQRPMLSGVTLTTVDGADTRYAVEEGAAGLKFNYENGDQIGAAIIDRFEKNEKPADWGIVNGQSGVSNPFTYDASTGIWSAINSIGVGHYIFTYPYNSTNIQRFNVAYELPVIQKLYKEGSDELDLNAAIEEGNMAIYSTLLEDETDINVEAYMRNMFAYPTFRINIDNGEEVNTVSQVVLEYKSGDGFLVKSGLNHGKVYAYFGDEPSVTMYDGTTVENDHYIAKTETTNWDAVQTADLILAKTGDEAYAPNEEYGYSKYIIAKLPEGTPFEYNSNTDNKTIDVRFMIPGALKATYNGNLAMHIYTDNGIFTIPDVWQAIDFNKTTDNATRNRALARNTSYTLTLKKSAVVDGEKYIVTTVDDWNELVSEYGDSKNFTAKKPLTVEVIGEEFAFGENTEMPEVAIFKVTTPVSVKSDVTMSNVMVSNDSKDNVLTVEKGATLTTSSKFSADEVENEGTLVIDIARNANDKVVDYGGNVNFPGITAIVNKGAVKIEKAKAIATFKLYNEAGATVENKGTINISNTDEEGREADDDSSTKLYGNLGIITNDGTINIVNQFANTTEYGETKNGKAPVVNAGVINNNAGASILATDNATLTNNAVINNAGTMTNSNKRGNITNTGKDAEMTIETTSITYITNNIDEAVIVVKSVDTSNLSVENQSAFVQYTTKAATDNFKDSQINWLVVDPSVKAYTVVRTDGEQFKQITAQGDLTLSYGEDSDKKKTAIDVNELLIVEKGTLNVGSDMTVDNVNVAKNATINIPTGKTMNIGGDNLNDLKGRIIVGGTLNAENIEYSENYNVQDLGGNGKVNWKDVDAANLKEAMDAAVAYWGDNFGEYISEETYYAGNPYEVSKFAETMKVWANQNAGSASNEEQKKDIESAQSLAKALGIAAASYNDINAWLEALTTDEEHKVAMSAFTTAIDDLLNGKVADLKKAIIDDKGAFKGLTLQRDDKKFYKDQTEAYNALRLAIAKASSIDGVDTYLVKASAWALTNVEIETALSKTEGGAAYMYVWDGSIVDEAVALWTTYTSISELDAVSYSKAQTKNGADLVSWINAALSLTSTNNPNLTAIHNKLSTLEITAENANEKVGGFSSEQITLCINGLED